MNASWFDVPVGAAAGAIGAAVILLFAGALPGTSWADRVPARGARRGSTRGRTGGGPASQVSAAVERREPAPAPREDDSAHDLCRCEQAVARAARAAHAVSSASAREGLLMVVHRMEAELPSVEALVQLGRSLAAQPEPPERTARVLHRVREQVSEAAAAFAAITDRLLQLVVEFVDRPDFQRMRSEVAVLRERFPLLRPMSEILGERRPSAAVGTPAPLPSC